MDDDVRSRMAEATRLTREGRLAEATALLQGSLSGGGGPSPLPSPPRTPRRDGPSTRAPGPSRGIRERLRDTLRDNGPAPSDAGGHPAPVPPGRFIDAGHDQPGGRSYKLYVPAGYTGAPVPLVVMLHGGTQDADDFATGTRMNLQAERSTFLVAYPEQSAGANQMRYWNWFRPADQQRDGGEPAQIAGITRQVARTHAVLPGSVYVTGFSAGGAMAAVMAATYPDLYAAAGVHSGLAYRAAHDVRSAFTAMRQGPARRSRLPGRAIPLIVFQGAQDPTVNRVNAERLVEQWTSAGGPAGRRPVEGGGAAPLRNSGRTAQGRSFTRHVHPDGRGGAAVELWLVRGAGHAWSGGAAAGSYTDPAGPDASAEMIRFFAEHAR